jgi:hypothetical protein
MCEIRKSSESTCICVCFLSRNQLDPPPLLQRVGMMGGGAVPEWMA